MKKFLGLFVVAALFAIVLTPVFANGGSEAAAPAEKMVYEFKLHHQDPPSAAMGEFFDYWAAKLDSESGGRIKISIYPGATLGSPRESYTIVTGGIADISWGMVPMFPGQFPQSDGVSLPMIGLKNAYMGSKIYWELYDQTDLMDAEFKDVHVIFLQTNMDAPLVTNDKKITTMADLKGLKIRASGGPITQFLTSLGATPVSIPITELYASLQKNIVNGAVTDWHAVDGFRLAETSKYYLDEALQVNPFWLVMSKAKWDSLPADIQDIFNKNGGANVLPKIEEYYNSRLENAKKAIVAAGGEVYKLSDAERAKWQEIARQSWSDWASANEAKGIQSQDLLDELLKRIAAFKR